MQGFIQYGSGKRREARGEQKECSDSRGEGRHLADVWRQCKEAIEAQKAGRQDARQ